MASVIVVHLRPRLQVRGQKHELVRLLAVGLIPSNAKQSPLFGSDRGTKFTNNMHEWDINLNLPILNIVEDQFGFIKQQLMKEAATVLLIV